MADIDPQLEELLSAYVDGELALEEADSLRKRIESEPQLASAVESLRADRQVRSLLWKSYEPDEAAVARLISRVDAAVDRQTVWAYRLSKFRVGAAAAACVLIGIMLGRATINSRDIGPGGPAGPTVAQAPVGSGSGAPIPGVTNVSAPIAPPQQYRIIGPDGKPVEGIRPFNSIREAQQFLDDMKFWQQEQERIKSGGSILPTDSEQF